MKHLSFKALAVAAALFTAGGAQAVTVSPFAVNLGIDSGWSAFTFNNVGTYATKAFKFTVVGNAFLTITDGYQAGDIFEVFANNISRGLTSIPQSTTAKIGNKWDLALASTNFSHRKFRLSAGTYVISMLVHNRSSTPGSHIGAIRVDTANVPVPAAGLMLISALGAAGAARRRRKQAS